jgi:mono/diheme cytochrome c family protein
MVKYPLILGTLAVASLLTAAAVERRGAGTDASDDIARGKYLAMIAGCNDCHTPGYMMTAGKVDEKVWLTGEALGWSGPWGTTYPSNLRLLVQNMTADQFMTHARSPQRRPPMPWFALRDMTDADVKAIYAFLKHLGPAGKPAPAYLPPGQQAQGPVVVFPAPPK